MSLLPPVFTLLKNDPAVFAEVGTRIYRHGSAPQKGEAPYITWFLITGVPDNALDELPRIDRLEVQVDVWSDNTGTGSSGVEVLAQAVRDALEPEAHMTAIVTDERDFETQRYHMGMQFTFWDHREEVS